ncbi:MAG: histidine phosphatase family protein [Acutalibacteraceae bacterium]|nr:histidine phosphatase family protein [Acutalibacteraceae bacterium]
MRTLKIHLIRHGATDANYKGQYIGCKTDLPLAPEGLNELRLLKDDIDYPEIQKLYSSPLLRCKQTGAVLYPDMPITLVENLKEYDFGDFEGKTARELELHPNFKDWTSGKLTSPPNGEDNTEFIKRLCLGLRQIIVDMLNEGIESAGVIMHGGAIMMLLGACAVPQRRPVEWTADNGQGYSLLVTPSLYHKSGIVEVFDVI